MKILYASCLCSEVEYNKMFMNTENKPGQQVQKYHRLIVEGITKNNIAVETITALPITKANYSKIIKKGKSENVNGVNYNYLLLINIPIIKNVIAFLMSFFFTLKACIKNKELVVIGDVLNISVCTGSLCAAKILKRKNIGIVTDIPAFLNRNLNKFFLYMNNKLISSFDSYLFLTQEMNGLINKKNKPYVVIEGQVDVNMKEIQNSISNKYNKKVCIYAGLLQKIYGIDLLINSFIKADVPNSELHLYGCGDYEKKIKEICKLHSNIKYFGIKLNDYIVKEEIKATLLINPRPTNEEYTKYSFPSKNMEYMASGTAVLTTKLPGMPFEYYPYVYLIEEESIEGMSLSLKKVLSISIEGLHKKGKKAKDFVLKEKNNVVQAKKIIETINKI